jgi:dynein heavy chain
LKRNKLIVFLYFSEIIEKREKYLNGLEKLETTANKIVEMKKNLIEVLKPDLIEKSEKIEQIFQVIEKESIQMTKVETNVRQEELIAEQQAKEAERIKLECKKALDEVAPLYNQALSALDTITSQVSLKNILKTYTVFNIFILLFRGYSSYEINEKST